MRTVGDCSKHGGNTLDRRVEREPPPNPGERVRDVRFEHDRMSVDLVDGRTITVPIRWYPRLWTATPRQRETWELAGGGYGIHWPEVDEDLSVEGLLRGTPAPGGEATIP
jgi:hypothetical protein